MLPWYVARRINWQHIPGAGIMIPGKSKISVLVSLALLITTFCGQQATAAEPPAGATPMTPEQRATARAAAQARSANTAFNTAPLINPNTATKEQLAAIPGMTEARVQAVLTGRPFATPTALHEAIGKGMSDEERFIVYSAMFVKVNLNTAKSADFELVPSTMPPARLVREFEEYRPYKAMSDFSREMKKYVSEKEVAFLERFVTIN
jgi:DNA uptake protein ComE-like DNA-binding protein